MPSTYMDLTNRLLRRLNEVEIAESDFLSVTGIHATAKDCVLDAIREINLSKIDWPFNAVEHTQTLVVSVEEYDWPTDFTAADWDSFQIQKDTNLGVGHKRLIPISREEWYDYLRDMDYDSEDEGKNIPSYCFPSHGQGFGVSPSPNQAYSLKYRYYKNPTDVSLFDDEVTIPSKFDYVIMAGALYHLNLFKENAAAADRAEKRFEKGIADMTKVYLPNPRKMWAGVLTHRKKSGRIWTGY